MGQEEGEKGGRQRKNKGRRRDGEREGAEKSRESRDGEYYCITTFC